MASQNRRLGFASFSRSKSRASRWAVERLEERTLMDGDFGFAIGFGSNFGADSGRAVATDAADNVYVAGSFSGFLDFDPGPGMTVLNAIEEDAFVAKYSSAGDLIWARSLGAEQGNTAAIRIAVDGSGNVVTTGRFVGTADFDPGPATSNLTALAASVGTADTFISKLDRDGNLVFVRHLGGGLGVDVTAIALDGAGNLYMTGDFSLTVDFDPGLGTSELTGPGNVDDRDIFVTKLNASGNFVFARQFRGAGPNLGTGISVDGSGNIYATGAFGGTVDFDPGGGTSFLTALGTTDAFLSKLDNDGNFIFVRRFVASAGVAVALDAANDVYTVGVFAGTVDFDPGAGVSNLTSFGDVDIFVSKLDSNGSFVYARQQGGPLVDQPTAAAVDGLGNVVLTGTFSGTADFDPGAGTRNLTSDGTTDVFVSKLDSSGILTFAGQFAGGPASGRDSSFGIALDAAGNIYTTGTFTDTVDFDPGAQTNNLTSIGSNDTFLAKLDSDGNLLRVIGLGSAGSGGTDGGQAVATDGSHVYVAGNFQGTADFESGPGQSLLTATGTQNVFVAKYTSNAVLVWARAFNATASVNVRGIAVDGSGNVYTTGSFVGTVDFDPGPAAVNLTTSTKRDVFVSKLDSNGDFVFARQLGGTLDDDGRGIAVDDSGNVFTTGSFQGTADFDPGVGITNIESFGLDDSFVAKLDSGGNLVFARQFGGSSVDQGFGIALDDATNIYTTGFFFSSSADFDPGPGTSTLARGGTSDAYVSKLDSSGNFVFARRVDEGQIDLGLSIAVDAAGSVFTTGLAAATGSRGDIFVAKHDSAGTPVFLHRFGSGQNFQTSSGNGITTASN